MVLFHGVQAPLRSILENEVVNPYRSRNGPMFFHNKTEITVFRIGRGRGPEKYWYCARLRALIYLSVCFAPASRTLS